MRPVAALLLGCLAACRADPGRIMSFEEYAHADDTSPIVVRAARGRGRLLYFGARHNFDPDDPQVEHITRLWREFAPTLLLYEGPRHDAPTAAIDQVIRAEGDGGLVRWLAARDHVPVRSLDPDEATQVAGLITAGYSADDIALYFALRQVMHERRNHAGEALDRRMQVVLDHYRAVPGLGAAPRTLAAFAARVRARFPELPDWRAVPEAWFDPAVLDHPHWANRLSRRLSELRDEHMVRTIDAALRDGQRVFAVAGASHVVMQAPALRRARRRVLVGFKAQPDRTPEGRETDARHERPSAASACASGHVPQRSRRPASRLLRVRRARGRGMGRPRIRGQVTPTTSGAPGR